jgi:hypothetical protein
MTTLFLDHTGPLVRYDGDLLYIDDLNPSVETRWRMTRGEMIRFGWRCIVAALKNAHA